MSAEIVRMADHAPVPSPDQGHVCDQLADWVEALKSGAYGEVRTISVVVENGRGKVGTINLSTAQLDTVRLAGLLTLAAHRVMDGKAKIEGLEVDEQ